MANLKLTLNIQDRVIEKAKIYASQQKISLSKIVEYYLDTITEKKEMNELPVSPWTKELAAVKKPTTDFNHKSGYRDHIIDKHSAK